MGRADRAEYAPHRFMGGGIGRLDGTMRGTDRGAIQAHGGR